MSGSADSGYRCYIKSHGSFQIEIKMRYPFSSRNTVFGAEYYIFSPKVLSVNSRTYSPGMFLSDLKMLNRLSSPEMTLKQLIDMENDDSPLKRIKDILDGSVGNISKREETRIMYELRTLASIIRVQIRKSRFFLKRKLEKEADRDLLADWLQDFFADIKATLSVFRDMKKYFFKPEAGTLLGSAFAWTDESVSLNLQRELGIICEISRKSSFKPDVIKDLIELIESEMRYRKKNKPAGKTLDKEIEAEDTIIYRENILKKWSQSVLYLTEGRSRLPARTGQIIAGAAAAAAMTFAVTASILTNRFFPQNTTAWALAAVAAYILKDRIKEIIRAGLKIMFPELIPDKMNIIFDTGMQKKVGVSSFNVRFSGSDRMNSEIMSLRGWDKKPFRELLPAEDVIVCSHKMKVKGKTLIKYHDRSRAVIEIIRLELSKFIQLMDDPVQSYFYSENGKIKRKKQRRTYHLNLITVLKDAGGRNAGILHHRIVLNRDGIISVEKDRGK